MGSDSGWFGLSVGNSFRFPICQRLWDLIKRRETIAVANMVADMVADMVVVKVADKVVDIVADKKKKNDWPI